MADRRQKQRARRAAQLERDAAAALGSRRTARIGSYASEPDVATIVVHGETIQAECKSRVRAPRVITRGLDQARRYCPVAVPLVIIREAGAAAIACMPLADLCRLLGIDSNELPTKNKPTKRDPRQCEMFA